MIDDKFAAKLWKNELQRSVSAPAMSLGEARPMIDCVETTNQCWLVSSTTSKKVSRSAYMRACESVCVCVLLLIVTLPPEMRSRP